MNRFGYIIAGWIVMVVASFSLAQGVRVGADACRWKDLPNTDTVFVPKTYASLKAWTPRSLWLREQVSVAAGLVPEPVKTDLNPQVVGTIEYPDCTIERVYFESQPGVYVTGNLYKPRNIKGKIPAIACPHGHWPEGRLEHSERCSVLARCVTFAKMGIAVFAYDMLCYNDSGKTLDFDHRDKRLSSDANALWGIGPLQLQTYNSIRVLDYLQSLPYVDIERMGMTGASGGGTQTFIVSAFDYRVQAAAPVNMISSMMQGGCFCENAAGLRIDTENMEIAALQGPRSLMMVSASGDWTKNTPKVEYPFMRRMYELWSSPELLSHTHIDAEHNYNRQSRDAVYKYFVKRFFKTPLEQPATDEVTELPDPKALLVFDDEHPAPAKLSYDQLIARLKQSVNDRLLTLRPMLDSAQQDSRYQVTDLMKAVQQTIRHGVGSDLGKSDVSWRIFTDNGTQARMMFMRNKRIVHAMKYLAQVTPKEGKRLPITIVVHPKGLAGADDIMPLIDQQRDDGFDVLLIEPFGTGASVPPADAKPARGTTKFFTTFNRTDDAEAIYDILTVLGYFVNLRDMPEVRLVGLGEMGPLTLTARAMVEKLLAERKGGVRTAIDLNQFDPDSDDAYLKHLFIPNIRRVGGLDALTTSAATGPLWLFNSHANFKGDWALTQAGISVAPLRMTKDEVEPEAIGSWLSDER